MLKSAIYNSQGIETSLCKKKSPYEIYKVYTQCIKEEGSESFHLRSLENGENDVYDSVPNHSKLTNYLAI